MKYKKPDQDFDDYTERSFLWEEGSEDHECPYCGKHFSGDPVHVSCRICGETKVTIKKTIEDFSVKDKTEGT